MSLELERARLRFLLKLPPSVLVKHTTEAEFSTLFGQYIAKARAEHAALEEKILNSPAVHQAMIYDYDAAQQAMEQATFTLPGGQVFLTQINGYLGTVQAWRDYIEAFYRVACENHSILSDAWDTLVADWQVRALADTDMQGKIEGQALHPGLREKVGKADRMRDRAKKLFDRLQSQWMTLSRQASIAIQAREAGDFLVSSQVPIPTRDQGG